MKKFTWICCGLTALLLILSLGLIMIAPATIDVHFNGSGYADAQGSRWMLLLEPAIYAVVAGMMITTSKSKRKQIGMTDINFLTVQECLWTGELIVILVIFGGLMMHQIRLF